MKNKKSKLHLRIVLYSGGAKKSNQKLHQRFAELAKERQGEKKNKGPLSVTYIAYCDDGHEIFYKRFVNRYSSFGFKNFMCIASDQMPDKNQMAFLKSCDAIYLAGGNTYYFLHHLKKNKLFEVIKSQANLGTAIAGLSAGALILSPSIDLAAIPEHEADENDIGLTNLKGLNFFNFEFSPHFHQKKREIESLMNYSEKQNAYVYAARDGSGIVINQGKLERYGKVFVFYRGLYYSQSI